MVSPPTTPAHTLPIAAAVSGVAADGPIGTTDFDLRWAAWQRRGVIHERAARRKFLTVAPIVAVAAWIVWSLMNA